MMAPVTVTPPPVGPIGPVSPIDPVGPIGPVIPEPPLGPVAPVGPDDPVAPIGPADPVAPTIECGYSTFRISSCVCIAIKASFASFIVPKSRDIILLLKFIFNILLETVVLFTKNGLIVNLITPLISYMCRFLSVMDSGLKKVSILKFILYIYFKQY